MSDRPGGGKKQEDLSPEELWKRVSQQLSNKKYEAASRAAYNSLYDFSSITKEIARTAEQRIGEMSENEFYRTEIENSFLRIPLPLELEPTFETQKECEVPSFFPTEPLYQFKDPDFYKRLDLDTLFFIFYYYKGTVQQTYAAMQLKQYAWRFHLKYKMWFQRLDEPKLITTEYEKGEFLFFDYETTWNFMKKNDFVFEYYYLEHNDHF